MSKDKEGTIAGAATLRDGEMMRAEVLGTPVLLLRAGNELRAYSLECPHQGAELHEGLGSAGSIICPWHHAHFYALTGELQEPPALEGLKQYRVRREGEQVIVTIPADPSASFSPTSALNRDGCFTSCNQTKGA